MRLSTSLLKHTTFDDLILHIIGIYGTRSLLRSFRLASPKQIRLLWAILVHR
jgi:hypothetical protein